MNRDHTDERRPLGRRSSFPSLGAKLRALDLRMLRFLPTHAHHPSLEASVIALARAGENGLLWHGLAVAGIAFHGERRPVCIRSMGVVLTTLAANSAVKFVVRRALALGRPPPGPLYGLAAAMALSRPYLGVHYPSDILAGALLGDAVGRLLTP